MKNEAKRVFLGLFPNTGQELYKTGEKTFLDAKSYFKNS